MAGEKNASEAAAARSPQNKPIAEPSRRSFLFTAAAAAIVPEVLIAEESPIRRMLQRNAYPPNAETPIELLTTYITPNDLFFVRHHWVPQPIDTGSWRLKIDGEVGQTLELSLSDLKKMPKVDVTCVLQCAGNGRSLTNPRVPGLQWGAGAIGNAQWSGVRVRDLLARAKVKPAAKHLHTFGSDLPPGLVPPFHRSVPIDKLIADGIVAYEMNGIALPDLHGGPARLVVPGWTGNHWMKWLARLSAQTEPLKGFFMDVGYRYPRTPGTPGTPLKPEEMNPVTEMFVKSTITTAPKKARVGQTVVVRGFAFSGAPDVAKVEISEDDGRTWKDALLDPQHDPYAWRLWSHRLTPRAAGRVKLLARATDIRGSVQPRDAVWNQSGYLNNGWHSVEIEVTA